MIRYLSKILFIYFVLLQIISIHIGYNIDETRVIFRLTLFETGFFIALLFLLFRIKNGFVRETNSDNRLIIKIIIIYTIYQLLVIFPLSFYELKLPLTHMLRNLVPRLFFLLIPFIYWLVLPNYKNIKVPIQIIAYSAILLLILSFYNYINGIYIITNTGELRLVSGVAAMLFTYTLVTSFSILSHTKNNIILIAVSLIGLVFVNHRSAYLMLGFILMLSIFISVINTQKNKIKFSRIGASFVIIILLLIPLSQIPLIKENFTGRIATAFDVNDPNAKDRMMRWGLSFSYFLENPINGSKLEKKYYSDDDLLREYYEPHNFIFEILSTQGIVGFIFISFILFSIIKIGYKNRNDNISYQMFLIIIFYILYSLLNVTILNNWNIMILVFPSAVILYRNKQLKNENYSLKRTNYV